MIRPPMKLVTYDRGGARRLGAWVAGTVVDLPDAVGHPAFPTTMEALVARHGGTTLDAARTAIADPDLVAGCSVERARLLVPILPASLRDFDAFATGRHAGQPGGRRPDRVPTFPPYSKGNHRSVLGPGEELAWPAFTRALDYELEVACVVGGAGRDVRPEDARAMIFGYTIMNDWSARDLRRDELAACLGPGKSTDFATSLGPCIVTPDEFDPSAARMVARVDGEGWSEGDLGAARWRFPQMIAHAARGEDVLPGDVYGSGAFAGGCGADLGRRLPDGCVVDLEVEGLGVLRTRVLPRGTPPARRAPSARRMQDRAASIALLR